MKTHEEIYQSAIERRNSYQAKRARIIRGVTLSAACFAVVAVAVIGVRGMRLGKSADAADIKSTDDIEYIVNYGGSERNEAGSASGIVTDSSLVSQNPGNTENYETSVANEENIRAGAPGKPGPDKTGDKEGGYQYSGGVAIPATPDVMGAKPGVVTTGEKITDAEAKAYFDENRQSIVNSLSASGVSADNIMIEEKGYSHVSYDGTEGKPLELRQNFRDYLIYNGDELVSIYTLTKEDGKLYGSPAFGGPWFPDYNNYLKAHRGQKLLYVYAGFMEIIIAPDNTYVNPIGTDISEFMKGIDKPYEYFYAEGATYTP